MAHISNLEQAVALDMEKWLQTLPEEAPAYAFSEKYKKFRVKLFDKMRGEKYHRFTKRATVAIIVAAILFAMAVATLAATVGKDFILKHFNGYAEVEVVDSENAVIVNALSIGFVPDGFIKVDEFVSDATTTYSYSKSDKWFTVTKVKLDSGMTFDEENRIEKITINNVEYLYSYSSDANNFLWNNGQYSFNLIGNLDKDLLLKIAENVR